MTARSKNKSNQAQHCPELHEEINRLPERFRLPIVLCYLEGLTHDQAAQRLGWPLGTVESRLARARDRLRKRLTGRGVTPGAAMLGARSLSELASAAVPSGWIAATARSATQFAGGKAAATVASANVAFLTQGTLKTMALTQIKLVMAYTLSAALGATGLIALLQAVSTDAPKSPAVAPVQASKPAAERPDSAPQPKLEPTTIKVSGRALDPTGKPLQGSRLWLAFRRVMPKRRARF